MTEIDNSKTQYRELNEDEKLMTDKAIALYHDRIENLEYDMKLNKLAIDEGLDIKIKEKRQLLEKALKQNDVELKELQTGLAIFKTHLAKGVPIKEVVDVSNIEYDLETMKEFLKEHDLERAYYFFSKKDGGEE